MTTSASPSHQRREARRKPSLQTDLIEKVGVAVYLAGLFAGVLVALFVILAYLVAPCS